MHSFVVEFSYNNEFDVSLSVRDKKLGDEDVSSKESMLNNKNNYKNSNYKNNCNKLN